MAFLDYKSIADESEPSMCVDFSTYSDTSSIISTEDEDINNLLQRRTSISLFNVSTPVESQEKSRRLRSASHYNINSERQKRKYKPYVSNKSQSDKNENEDPKIRIEQLEVDTTSKQHNVNFSPDISFKYTQALKEIETLQMQINKMKSERSVTPIFVRRKSMQSSMIKTCLFRNSSSVLRPQYNNSSTRSSLFDTNSTCMTIDIEDNKISPHRDNEVLNGFTLINNNETKENPFFITAESPTSDKSYNSDAPLISGTRKKEKQHSKMHKFMSKFIKCPEFLKKITLDKHNTTFHNKISPIPKVVIFSPRTSDGDSGNDSDIKVRLADINCNTPDVEKIVTDMTKCAEELTQKLNILKGVLDKNTTPKHLHHLHI